MKESETYSNSIFNKNNPHYTHSHYSRSHNFNQSSNSHDRNETTPQRIHNTSGNYTTETHGMVYGTNILSKQVYSNLEAFVVDF